MTHGVGCRLARRSLRLGGLLCVGDRYRRLRPPAKDMPALRAWSRGCAKSIASRENQSATARWRRWLNQADATSDRYNLLAASIAYGLYSRSCCRFNKTSGTNGCTLATDGALLQWRANPRSVVILDVLAVLARANRKTVRNNESDEIIVSRRFVPIFIRWHLPG